jgi:AcrR family transcriptional regulator
VREIADLAGVTKPALYYHFGSKEGLLLAILTQAERQFAETVASAATRPGTARDRITALCEDIYALFGENVPVARVAHSVLLGPPDAAPPFDITAFEGRFRETIETIAAEGIASGEIRDVPARDIALAVMGVLEACHVRQMHPAFEPVGPEVVHRLVQLVFDGVMSTPRS